MTIETKNAVIESTTLTNDDHGCLSAWLHLDYGGSGQGFGGYALYLPNSYKHHAGQGPAAGHFIYRCLEIAGVSEWSNLAGRTIRVRADHGKVHAIGHIVKDDWFDPCADFEAMRPPSPSSGVDVALVREYMDANAQLAYCDGEDPDGPQKWVEASRRFTRADEALRRALSPAPTTPDARGVDVEAVVRRFNAWGSCPSLTAEQLAQVQDGIRAALNP